MMCSLAAWRTLSETRTEEEELVHGLNRDERRILGRQCAALIDAGYITFWYIVALCAFLSSSTRLSLNLLLIIHPNIHSAARNIYSVVALQPNWSSIHHVL